MSGQARYNILHPFILLFHALDKPDLSPGSLQVMVFVMDPVINISVDIIGKEPEGLFISDQQWAKGQVFLFSGVKGFSCLRKVSFRVCTEKSDIHPDL